MTTGYQMPPAPQSVERAFDKYRRELSLDAVPESPPAVLARADGEPVLYESRFNTVLGRPGTAKSWIALLAAKAALSGGARVVWIDHEEHSNVTMSERCRTLGIQAAFETDGPLLYFGGEFAHDKDAVKDAMCWGVNGDRAPLVVVDAAASGGCPSDGSEVKKWYAQHVEPWQRQGFTVILIDHVAKRSTEKLEGGLGSTHKLAVIDGVALQAEGRAWTPNKNGKVRLTVHKDRVGSIGGRGDTAAVVVGTHKQISGFAYLDIEIVEPLKDQPETAAPTLPEHLETVLADAGSGGVRGHANLRGLVKGATAEKDEALQALIDSGRVECLKDGHALNYRLLDLP